MVGFMKELNMQILIFIILIGALYLGFRDWSSDEEKATRSQVSKWAEKLDRNVNSSGVYIQWESDTLPENDAWGTPLKVDYRNEGLAEFVYVKSAGEDLTWDTEDDLQSSRMQLNAKGIGVGIKENTAEVAKEATKGIAEGVKEETGKAVDAAKEKTKEVTLAAKEKAWGFFNGLKGDASKETEP